MPVADVKPKRILRRMRIDEISGVTKPAQEPALAAIIKRDMSADSTKREAEEKRMSDEKIKELEAKLAKSKEASETASKAAADLIKGLEDKNDALTKEVANLKKSVDIVKNDEILEIEGVAIRKSEMGDASFAILKKQQEIIELGKFEKMADAEIPHLPGTAAEKAVSLRAITKLEKGVSEGITKLLKAGSEALGKLMKSTGKEGKSVENEDDPVAKIDQLAKDVAKKDNISYHTAYAKVLETDEGRALYKASRPAMFQAVK